MSLLSLIRSVCPRIGVPRPLLVAQATDPTTVLLLELAQQEGVELAAYGDWRALRAEKTFTTVAAETQTDTPLPADFLGFVDGTLWNRSTRQRLTGPYSPDEWQRYKASASFPVRDGFTLRGTSWLMGPVPAAGQTIAYEYRSNNWCQSSGGTGQSAWAADTDTGRLSERLMALGLIWRFKENRLPGSGAAERDTYNAQVADALAKDQPRRIVNMSGPVGPMYGAAVPEGSWPVA